MFLNLKFKDTLNLLTFYLKNCFFFSNHFYFVIFEKVTSLNSLCVCAFYNFFIVCVTNLIGGCKYQDDLL